MAKKRGKNVGLPNFFIQYLVLGGVLHGGLEASWHAEGQIIIASVDSVHYVMQVTPAAPCWTSHCPCTHPDTPECVFIRENTFFHCLGVKSLYYLQKTSLFQFIALVRRGFGAALLADKFRSRRRRSEWYVQPHFSTVLDIISLFDKML